MAEAEKAGLVKSYNLTESSLQSKCSDDHMAEIEKFISWEEVGRHLPKITRLHLRDIDNDGRTQQKKRHLLLDKWEESNGDDATYDAMITAMLKAGKKAEATSVCQLLQSLSGTPVRPRHGPGGPLGPRGGTTLADSPGIAILVTCDYKAITSKGQLSTLVGTNEDAKIVKETFDFFNYIIYQLQNEQATRDDIKALLKDISKDLSAYKGDMERKVIMFAFSGHGTNEDESEKIFANDGQTLDIKDEIVLPLTMHKAVEDIPKLFFIDACRGEMALVSKGTGGAGGGANSTPKSTDEQYFEKGVQHVEGNYRIDYATIPDHVSYAGTGGSMWLPKLALALREKNDSFQNIADNVKKQVHQQLGESVNRLNIGALYLQK